MSAGFVSHPDANARLAMLLKDTPRVTPTSSEQAPAATPRNPLANARDQRAPGTPLTKGSSDN